MLDEGIYKVGIFEFDTWSGRLWRTDDPNHAIPLHDKEARLLEFLIENYGKASTKKELKYNDRIIDEVWRGKPVGNDSLVASISILREAFEDKGWEYIKSGPYELKLDEKPTLIRRTVGGSPLDRSELLVDKCDVIADVRADCCLLASTFNCPAWNENAPPRLTIDPSRSNHYLLSRYLFPLPNDGRNSTDRVAVVTGIDDKYDHISHRKFSESGSAVTADYINAFRTSNIQRVSELKKLATDDALVLIGSHEVNPKARDYMGDPDTHTPHHRIAGRAARKVGYEAELPWTIFTPEDARDIRILQTRELQSAPVVRKTKEHVVSFLEGAPSRSVAGKSGGRDVWLTDYLLITALPTDATEQRRVISFAGLHRTGTLAAGKLLTEAPPEIVGALHKMLGDERYFQALISLEVDNSASDKGRAQPGRFTGVKATPIRIRKLGRNS